MAPNCAGASLPPGSFQTNGVLSCHPGVTVPIALPLAVGIDVSACRCLWLLPMMMGVEGIVVWLWYLTIMELLGGVSTHHVLFWFEMILALMLCPMMSPRCLRCHITLSRCCSLDDGDILKWMVEWLVTARVCSCSMSLLFLGMKKLGEWEL